MLNIQNKPGKPYITILSIDSDRGLSEYDYEYIKEHLGEPLPVYALYHCTDGRIGHLEIYRDDLGDTIVIDTRVVCKMKLTYL